MWEFSDGRHDKNTCNILHVTAQIDWSYSLYRWTYSTENISQTWLGKASFGKGIQGYLKASMKKFDTDLENKINNANDHSAWCTQVSTGIPNMEQTRNEEATQISTICKTKVPYHDDQHTLPALTVTNLFRLKLACSAHPKAFLNWWITIWSSSATMDTQKHVQI